MMTKAQKDHVEAAAVRLASLIQTLHEMVAYDGDSQLGYTDVEVAGVLSALDNLSLSVERVFEK